MLITMSCTTRCLLMLKPIYRRLHRKKSALMTRVESGRALAGGLYSWTYYRNIEPALLLTLTNMMVKLDMMKQKKEEEQLKGKNHDAMTPTRASSPPVL